MDKQDIRDLRKMHRAAALRGRRAGYDLIYVYAGHGLGIFQQFLSRATNGRSDEYGGPLANRARLLREVIEDTKDAVGDRCDRQVRVVLEHVQDLLVGVVETCLVHECLPRSGALRKRMER